MQKQKQRDKQSELEYETGEVIAVFKAGVTDEQIAEIAGYVGKDYDMISTFEIDETLPENKLERLKSVGNQEFPKVVSIHIDLDKTVSRAEEILDTLFSVKATSENNTNIKTADIFTDLGVDDEDVDYQEEFLRQIKVPTAWKSWNESGYDITYSQVYVAVIDTGLDITHPDLKNMYSKEKSATIGHNGVSSIEKMDATYPQNIHVGRASYQSIRIKWDPVEWAERYVIFRSTSANGTYTKIQSIRSRDGDQLTDTNGRYQYVDAGLDTGSAYYYKIRAACTYKDGFRFSEYCPVANAKCTLDTPTGLTLIPTVGKMTFSWKKVNGANGYLISKATSKNGTFTRIKEITNGSTLSFVDTAVTAGKTYYYRMRAYRTVNGKKVISNLTEIVSKQAK
ncbi:hypothetical protein AALA00_13015 [Lachnospiraceae bacterium 46-15]